MKFLVYFIILFSFFHFLIGYGIFGSVLATALLIALSPFIMVGLSVVVVTLWAGVLFLFGSIVIGAQVLRGKLVKK